MDYEAAKERIKREIPCTRYLKKSPKGQYCCPLPNCGSGTKTGTGAMAYYKNDNSVYCFSCGRREDVIGLYMAINGIDFPEAVKELAGEIGIKIDKPNAKKPEQAPGEGTETPQEPFSLLDRIKPLKEKETPQEGEKMANESIENETQAADFREYYRQCRDRLKDPQAAAYLKRRGISTETAKSFFVGYDPAADPAQSGHPCPRIIIPTSRTHYIGRAVDQSTPQQFAKMNNKGGHPDIFNKNAIYAQEVQEIFVVEGAFDALSLLEIGYTAIALNSASNGKLLVNAIREAKDRPAASFILCPDNDADKETAAKVKGHFEELAAELRQIDISSVVVDICGPYKDANEYLTKDRAGFEKAAKKAQQETAERPDNTSYYIDKMMTGEIERFKGDKKTGFAALDARSGGLYSGLYVLAALPSLGKTTFALQIGDQLAAAGNDVMFFSLEQSRLELVSKSLARNTVMIGKDGKPDFFGAVTSLEIRKGQAIQQATTAATKYKAAVRDRMSIIEGNFSCDISFIGDKIRRYIERTGKRPVVIIDYLQILQPSQGAKWQGTKEIIDSAMTELKRLSRSEDLTIIVISSVNRDNYLLPFDFKSLKESGAIEYSSDVVWGLQLRCISSDAYQSKGDTKIAEKREMIREAKASNPRELELICLKNRYGVSNYTCYFKYYPANDLFIEDPIEELAADLPDEWKNTTWDNAKVY